MIHRLLPLFAAAAFALVTAAETVKDREGAVRKDRTERENDPRWIYNDVDKGFAEAKRTGKPLLVILRCVPCLACSGIDSQVLLDQSEASRAMDPFVRVRLINANTLDLSRFQFDFDLSFTTLLFNGDGTLYGRYGSWDHQTNAQQTATTGFQRFLEGGLALHQAYPANRESLAGKQAALTPYRTPVEIPGLAGKYTPLLNWNGKVVPSCVHCHQINDALRITLREQRQLIPESLVYPTPQPATVGLTLAPDDSARVTAVVPGSPADRAGFQTGDRIASLDGQPLLSIADFSWALHRLPTTAKVPAVILRSDSRLTLQLDLPAGWRHPSDISRRVGTWGMRAMAAGGLQLEDLSDSERLQRQIPADSLALLVKHAGEYGNHAAAKKAGFRKEDVIVSLEGRTNRFTESEWIGSALLRHLPGTNLPAVVLRGTERLELRLPIQ